MTTPAFTFDLVRFRRQFRRFSDTNRFPDATLTECWNRADCFFKNTRGLCLSDDCRLRLLELMTAHLCRIDELIDQGKTPGIETSASVGGVSVSRVPPPFGTSQWQWWLNTTEYGQQFNALLSGAVAGGFYIGGRPERESFRKVGGQF